MGVFTWLFYIICGIFLFIFVELLRFKFKFNNFQCILLSILYMLVLAGICSKYGFNNLNSNIFLLFVFELIIRILYSSYVLNKDFFDREESNISYYIVLIIIGYLINNYFINRVKYVFLSGSDLRIIIWFILFMFLYELFKNNEFLKKVDNKEVKKLPNNENILVSYAKLKNQYNEYINCDNKDISNIIYSIMIYENYRRPKILRNYDNFRYRFDGSPRKLGIMQVNSKKFIGDIESIEIVYKKINKYYLKNNNNKKIDINKIFSYYDKDKYNEYMSIYNIISKF